VHLGKTCRPPTSLHIYSDNHAFCFTCSRQFSSVDVASFKGRVIDDLYAELVQKYGSEEKLLEDFKDAESTKYKPKRR